MTRKTSRPRFAICLSNQGCDDLAVRKLYRVLPDNAAARESFLRIVDESGKDYLYPATRFVVVDLAPAVVKKLLATTPPEDT
jgi:hypothetical protein